MSTEQAPPESLSWLVLGMVLGLLGVLVGILTPIWNESPNTAVVAIVNHTDITREKYLSYLQALSSDKKDPIDAEDSEYVLQRMIEEELLVQRGVEVGLPESDKRTRAALVNGVVSITTAAAEAKAPNDKELAEFLAQNIDYFTPTARLRARQLVVGGPSAERDAQSAYARLIAGETFESVHREFGVSVALSVPDSLLPPAKLREYLGPSLTRVLLEQAAPYTSKPMPSGSGFRIVQLVDKEVGQIPELEDVRDQLVVEYVRRAGDDALREYLEWLVARADISYPSELPL